MILGVTGHTHITRHQEATLHTLLTRLGLHVLHHGDCVGADAASHAVALGLHARIVVHPPLNPKLRAFCKGADEVLPPRAYLTRNRHIAHDSRDGLIALPESRFEVLRSGTWSTVRYARELKRRIWIVDVDGKWHEEAA